MVTRTRQMLRYTYIACLVIVTIHHNYANETDKVCKSKKK